MLLFKNQFYNEIWDENKTPITWHKIIEKELQFLIWLAKNMIC